MTSSNPEMEMENNPSVYRKYMQVFPAAHENLNFPPPPHLKHLEDYVPDPGLGEGLGGALPHQAEQVSLHVLEDEVETRVLADNLCSITRI